MVIRMVRHTASRSKTLQNVVPERRSVRLLAVHLKGRRGESPIPTTPRSISCGVVPYYTSSSPLTWGSYVPLFSRKSSPPNRLKPEHKGREIKQWKKTIAEPRDPRPRLAANTGKRSESLQQLQSAVAGRNGPSSTGRRATSSRPSRVLTYDEVDFNPTTRAGELSPPSSRSSANVGAGCHRRMAGPYAAYASARRRRAGPSFDARSGRTPSSNISWVAGRRSSLAEIYEPFNVVPDALSASIISEAGGWYTKAI